MDLRDLYQEVILDHNKRPRNFHALEGASHTAEGFNPLCGDRLTVHLRVEAGVVTEASFEGSGCAISKASASMMTESVKGRRMEDVERLAEDFHRMVTAPPGAIPEIGALGKLAALAGVREYPVRVKCATLAWHTLREALLRESPTVSTE
ncbi:MAG: Fe-S cluster assembly sulfur transfer protein SufU [Vicinamibacterales bacterium]